jgi:RNA polymerase-binding transcription factor
MEKHKARRRELTELRQRLVSEREKILALYRDDVHAAREIQEEGTEDFEELASMDVDRELLLALSESERERIQEIDDALLRMDEGSYGICLQSGRPIDLARLREVPWARYCVQHQGMVEDGRLRA